MDRLTARSLWPGGVALVTALLAGVPLLGSRDFYLRSDTTVQFAPTWYRLGEHLRAGWWPPTLDPDSWNGGNYAAEALHGIYNPLSWLVWLVVSGVEDLATGVYVVKTAALVVLAVGCYLLFREYGAAPWAAATVAVAVPWSGFTHYFDAAAFPSGLVAFAYAPWTWWAFRRTVRGTLNPWWAFVVGGLAVTHGNPYGVLAVVVIGLGACCEGLASGDRGGTARLAVCGLCLAALLPLVYLPLVRTVHLATRSDGPSSDSDRLSPHPLDLLGASNPGYVPEIVCGSIVCELPTTYLLWFLLPLLPWLDLRGARGHLRRHLCVLVVAVCYLVVLLGPAEVWFFRWPVRVSGYLLLALAVPVAVALGRGLRTDRLTRRAGATLLLVMVPAALTWWRGYDEVRRTGLVGAGSLLALALLLLAPHCWRPWSPRPLAAALLAGTAGVLVGQTLAFPVNDNLRDWPVSTSPETLQRRFADYDGRVLQLADLSVFQDGLAAGQRPPDADLLPGSMYDVAEVDAVNSYTGMGHRPFRDYLCTHYDGSTDACALDRLWAPLTPDGATLADLAELDLVVVQASQLETSEAGGPVVPPGWTRQQRGDVVLLRPPDPHDFAASRLSWASTGLTVTEARTLDRHREVLEVSAGPDGGVLVFALLGWPGYHAELDGRTLEVDHNEAGLLTVAVPPETTGRVVLSYTPPGWFLGFWCAGAGAATAAALGLWTGPLRRRGPPTRSRSTRCAARPGAARR